MAHEPAGTTTASAPSASSASSVVRATLAASPAKPEFHAGWPQHVWPLGTRHLAARRPQHAHGRHPTSGSKRSTTQVTNSVTRIAGDVTPAGRADTGRRGRRSLLPDRRRPEPAHVVLDDDVAVAFLDHRPVFPGHVLVVPRRHVETLLDLDADEVGPFFRRVRR